MLPKTLRLVFSQSFHSRYDHITVPSAFQLTSYIWKRAMVWSMVFAGVTTIITDLILLFCCGNYEAYYDSM